MKVKLELFEGPLDLLLYLIKKNHLDISNIPIKEVTQQYLEYLELMQLMDINIASEYLLMAATLIQIKSRMLLPKPEEEAQQEADPREELVQRLLEYEKYKQIAEKLKEKHKERETFIPRKSPLSLESFEGDDFYLEANIFDLITAFKNVLKDIPKDMFLQVISDEFTVEGKIHEILHLLLDQKQIKLTEIFLKSKSKQEIIAYFLAILELIRLKELTVAQEKMFGEIMIMRREARPEAHVEPHHGG